MIPENWNPCCCNFRKKDFSDGCCFSGIFLSKSLVGRHIRYQVSETMLCCFLYFRSQILFALLILTFTDNRKSISVRYRRDTHVATCVQIFILPKLCFREMTILSKWDFYWKFHLELFDSRVTHILTETINLDFGIYAFVYIWIANLTKKNLKG